jgi:cytochrome P450
VADHRYWEELHAIMLPLFTPAMVRGYFEQTARVVAEEVEHLAAIGERGETLNLLGFVRHGIFTALARTLFVRGVKPEDIPTLLHWFEESDSYMGRRYLVGTGADTDPDPKIAAGRAALEKLNGYIYDLIAYRKANLAETPEDMLDVLLAAKTSTGEPLSDIEIRDNVMALFFGGQETTPSVITWAFGLLSAHPDKREKMLAEIDQVLGGRAPTFQDLAKLEYTEMVLDEALRLYPPFSYIGREALEDVELGGYLVPKGSSLAFVGWTIHRNPKDWPDPEVFEPERHTREARAKRGKCAFVAFGYGQRRCTGERVGRMEGLLMLALVSQRFLLNRVGGGLSPHAVVLAIKPADGLPVRVAKRA